MENLQKRQLKKHKRYTLIHRVDSNEEVIIETGTIDVSELENEIEKTMGGQIK